MNNLKSIICGLLVLVFTLPASAKEQLYYTAPSSLPSVESDMKSPGFWVSRLKNPDSRVLTSKEIRKFNNKVQSQNLTKEITQLSPEAISAAREASLKTWEEFSAKEYFKMEGDVARAEFYGPVKINMNWENAPAQLSYGFIIRYADQRIFPTAEPLFAVKDDIDFDELQNSALDLGTPVALLQESKDGRWVFVLSETSDGWVRKENIVASSLEDIRKAEEAKKFVVVTAAKADLYADEKLTQFLGRVQMGARFPLIKSSKNFFKIKIPNSEAFIKKEDGREGFLDYTQRAAIEQAFKLLNAPYGWGGMYGEQDCSRFLQQIFSTFGIFLPRNSKEQALAGKLISEFPDEIEGVEKGKVLSTTEPGTILLYLKGHIMLYLGEYEGRHYAIHATWGYRENNGTEDIVRVLNRVVVSDLDLGKGSKKGSLLTRLKKIVQVMP